MPLAGPRMPQTNCSCALHSARQAGELQPDRNLLVCAVLPRACLTLPCMQKSARKLTGYSMHHFPSEAPPTGPVERGSPRATNRQRACWRHERTAARRWNVRMATRRWALGALQLHHSPRTRSTCRRSECWRKVRMHSRAERCPTTRADQPRQARRCT